MTAVEAVTRDMVAEAARAHTRAVASALGHKVWTPAQRAAWRVRVDNARAQRDRLRALYDEAHPETIDTYVGGVCPPLKREAA